MQKKSVIVTLLVISAILIASVLVLPALVQGNNKKTTADRMDNISLTDQTVYIFGQSQNTHQIADRLSLSTTNATLITDVTVLAKLNGRFILFVDGESFKGSYNDTIGPVTDAVRHIVLNGNPVVVLNRSVDFLETALDGLQVSVFDGYSNNDSSALDMIHGVKFYNEIGGSTCLTLDGRKDSEFGNSITISFNWANSYIGNSWPDS